MKDKSSFPTSCEQAKNRVIKSQASDKGATLVHTNAQTVHIELIQNETHKQSICALNVHLTHT